MMYHTLRSLYQHYLSQLPAPTLFSLCSILESLLQTYGPYKLQTPPFLTTIKKYHPPLHTLLQLLVQQKKLTQKSVKMLKTLVAPAAEREHPHVVITSPSETVNTDLKKTLTQQFKKADVTSALAEEIGLQVKGGVWSFERNLAKDLENLWR